MSFLEFAQTLQKFKKVKRSGWIEHGNIQRSDAESVTDHSYSLAMLALIHARSLDCNPEKLSLMALVHDLPEALVGDEIIEIGAKTVGSKEEKHKREKIAMQQIIRLLPKGDLLLQIWEEYNEQETHEARILKQLDKLEMAYQAFYYQKENNNINLEVFWENVRTHIKHPILLELLKEAEEKNTLA